MTFDEVHREVLHLFPSAPSSVLDIGAGSGRDAAALAARGHRVVAVEPTTEMRTLGRRLHADRTIAWIDDALPGLPRLSAQQLRFDLILLTAVWMHLDEQQRSSAMARLAGLLEAGGRVILSLRHGPVPEGRRMFPVTAQETVELARRSGLHVIHHARREDPHGRPGVAWTYLGLQLGAGSGTCPGGGETGPGNGGPGPGEEEPRPGKGEPGGPLCCGDDQAD
ncbi:class I SAM-dependent methyltransferase [Streptomyces roseoverticillatus]|uniref:class I SAM-dependent methyltransferase n=1 Tax=Streptomyces roseoverticillatus TaxID=66429 RepID=UPI001F2B0A2C|nr:class I SAM-dependent methyltransferase [Streptomyces roseoverticillatus]